MIGGLWLVPGEQVREGTWLIGAWVMMPGLNLARYMNCIRMSRFSIGLDDFFGADLLLIPILLILVGANIVWGVFTRKE